MAKRMCAAVDDGALFCGRPAIARELCTMHYQREKAAGNLAPLPKTERAECSVEDCQEVARVRGWCNRHYRRWRQTGDVRAGVPFQEHQRGRVCSRDDCDKPALSKGLCKRHYMQARTERLHQEPCIVASCDRPREMNNGYCARHYQRLLKHGSPSAGGKLRVLRGTGDRWIYDDMRRAAGAKMSQVTGETREYVKILRMDPCSYCGAPSEHIDHIVPFVKDGPTHWTNLAPACASCNHRKSDKDLLHFLLERIVA
jgi:5-methylcytosine-specific restriction endonuclease McrA